MSESEARVPRPQGGDAAGPLRRRAWPFALALALVALVVARLDFRSFVAALRGIHYVGFLGFAAAFVAALLVADAFATARVYRRTVAEVGFRDLVVLRGASYLPSILNHHVGQAWLTYFLARVCGAPLLAVAGATLLVYATTFGALLSLVVASLALGGGQLPWLRPVALGAAAGGLLYLAALGHLPQALREHRLIAPLARAGWRGHLVALAERLPHVLIQFVGAWVPFWFFGVRVPLGDALALMPVLMFLVVLPVAPQGVGTRDLFAQLALLPYATGSLDQRRAAVAAATLSWACTLTLLQVVLSSLLLRRAQRLLAAAGDGP